MTAESAANEAKKKSWFVIFDKAILEMDLTNYEKLVYIALVSYADRDGTCFPSAQAIAGKASCSRAQVFRAIKGLEACGLVVRHNRITARRGQSSNVYGLTAVSGQGDAGGISLRRPPSRTEPPGVSGGDAPIKVFEPEPYEAEPDNCSPPSPPRGEADRFCGPGPAKRAQAPEELSGERLLQGVVDAYNETLPELPRAAATKARASEIRRCLREDPSRRELGWWRRYFRRVRDYPWLMGEKAESNGWRAHFDWLLKEMPMQKVLEGSYPTRCLPRGGRTAAGDALQKRYMKNPEGGVVDAKALLRDLYESGMA